MEKKKLILATKNRGKVREFKEILPEYEILTIADIGLNIETVEDGETFEENAMKKAMDVYSACGETTIADDSGLVVKALGGAPGLYSARYSGEGATDKSNREKLLLNMKDVPDGEREAKFVCAIALILKNGEKHILSGECPGYITKEESGSNGFGYDSLFYVERFNKTFAQMEDFEKNQVSHRGQALLKVKKILG